MFIDEGPSIKESYAGEHGRDARYQGASNSVMLPATTNQSFGKIEKMLWEDSMVCALGSRYLARKLGLADPEEDGKTNFYFSNDHQQRAMPLPRQYQYNDCHTYSRSYYRLIGDCCCRIANERIEVERMG